MNRRERRWLSKQPRALRDEMENNHRLLLDLSHQLEIERAIDGVEAKIETDQDASDALRHFYEVTEAR